MGFGFARVQIKGIQISEGLLYMLAKKIVAVKRILESMKQKLAFWGEIYLVLLHYRIPIESPHRLCTNNQNVIFHLSLSVLPNKRTITYFCTITSAKSVIAHSLVKAIQSYN